MISIHWLTSLPPWPRGKGNCVPDCSHTSFDFGFGWFVDRLSSTVKIRHSLSWTDIGRRPPKTQVKAEREAQENTRQYREANVICLVLVFLTNI